MSSSTFSPEFPTTIYFHFLFPILSLRNNSGNLCWEIQVTMNYRSKSSSTGKFGSLRTVNSHFYCWKSFIKPLLVAIWEWLKLCTALRPAFFGRVCHHHMVSPPFQWLWIGSQKGFTQVPFPHIIPLARSSSSSWILLANCTNSLTTWCSTGIPCLSVPSSVTSFV